MKLIVCLFLSCAGFAAHAQNELRTYVSTQARPVRTISPGSPDFSDLESLGNAIGDSRIVMLGEQDHGDAPSFLAKTRLIEYLHATKGFNVIAFESDFFSATYGFGQSAKTKQEFLKFYRANLVPFWTMCDACEPLFTKIIPESFSTERPYKIAGFDNQMFYKYSTANLSQYIDSLARACDLDLVHDDGFYKSILSAITTLSNPMTCAAVSKSFYEKAIKDLTLLQQEIILKKGADDIGAALAGNLLTFARQLLIKNDFTAMVNTRDIQMAENLAWLCRVKFPGEKIIIWAANYHISKHMGNFRKKSLNSAKSMATEFVKDSSLDAQTYTIGFSSYDGEAGRIGTKTFTVDRPDKNGLETWFDPAVDYAFLDFRSFNHANPQFDQEFEMKSCVTDNNVHKSYPAQWNRVFDGVFFIRHMYPCKIK